MYFNPLPVGAYGSLNMVWMSLDRNLHTETLPFSPKMFINLTKKYTESNH